MSKKATKKKASAKPKKPAAKPKAKAKAGKQAKNPSGPKVARQVLLPLTPEAVSKRAKEAAVLSAELDKLVIEKKKSADDFKAQITDRAARVRILLREVETSKEEREVMCVEYRNHDRQTVEYYYKGERVAERPMEVADKQELLPLKENTVPVKTTEAPAPDAAPAPLPSGAVPRGEKQVLAAPAEEAPPANSTEEESEDIAATLRLETSRHTKHSAVDGPRA